ncbi:unnamed protein product [Caenorhabditis angaria]|uniref:Uncharacterized protein n=1 Tax=Caenorhabditis angaria TaxID=860376 RepID=A0A9P1N9B5_9PELO|nr:unnamed protein product [Caenorhabditis angaria]
METAGKDFIHANLVGYPQSDRTYIVTQHPLESTYEDFWRMVFYENCDTIIAIYSPDENLPHYYPNVVGKYFNQGQFFVNCRKVTPPQSKYAPTTYVIEVLPEGCSNARMVTLLHYSLWPHGKVPVSPKVILKLIRSITVDIGTKGPAVIHCATGTDRSGCFVLTDLIVDLMFRNLEVDIPAVIQTLRAQRSKLLSNKVYFAFALYAAADYVRLRLKRYKNAPDLLKEIDTFALSVTKEWASLIVKEQPQTNSKNNCFNCTK